MEWGLEGGGWKEHIYKNVRLYDNIPHRFRTNPMWIYIVENWRTFEDCSHICNYTADYDISSNYRNLTNPSVSSLLVRYKEQNHPKMPLGPA